MTMRTLALLRHAKAEDPAGYADDIDRPLSHRGRTDAVAVGQWLSETDLVPDRVLCSTAVRARDTWLAVASVVGEVSVLYEPSLYLAGASEALELVRQTDPTVSSLLVIGHNPGLSVLSRLLDPDGLADGGLKTSGLAVHRVEDAWSDTEEGSAPLVRSHTGRGR